MGEQIEVPSSKSQRLNILGFIDRQCHFKLHVFEGSVTSEIVVACFDKFAEMVTQKTVVLIDNAPIHTNHFFRKH